MDKKIEKQIIFSLLILIVIFFSLSQLLPWASLKNCSTFTQSLSNQVTRDNGNFYSWGFISDIDPNYNQTQGFHLFSFFKILDAIGETPVEMEEYIGFLKTQAIGFLSLFTAWILSIITIIFSLFTIYRLYYIKEEKMKQWIFSTSFTSITTLLIFYIGSVFLIINPTNNYLMYGSGWILQLQLSIGFFMFLIGTIIVTCLLLYFISKKFSERLNINNESNEKEKDQEKK